MLVSAVGRRAPHPGEAKTELPATEQPLEFVIDVFGEPEAVGIAGTDLLAKRQQVFSDDAIQRLLFWPASLIRRAALVSDFGGGEVMRNRTRQHRWLSAVAAWMMRPSAHAVAN